MQTIATDLAARLRVSVARLARRLRQEGMPGDTPSQYSALATLYREGALTLSELASIEHVKPPTMTRIVTALESRGLLSKQPDERDRRVVRIALSADGRRAFERARNQRTAWLAMRLKDLTPSDRAALDRAVEIMSEIADE